MKQISSQLLGFLQSHTAFNMADLITIELTNGTSLNVVSGANIDIVYGDPAGQGSTKTYYASQYGVWERGSITTEAAFSPKSNTVDLVADIPSTVVFPGTSISLMSVLAQNYGLFNGAIVTIDTLYWPIGERYTTLWSPSNASYATEQGTIRIWAGQIGNVKSTGRSQVTFECYDMLYILNRQTPSNLIQSGCRYTLFDEGCALLEENFTAHSSVAAGSNNLNVVMNIPAFQTFHNYSFGDMVIDTNGNPQWMSILAGSSSGANPAWNTAIDQSTFTGGCIFINCIPNYYNQGKLKFTSGNNGGLVFPIKLQTLSGGVVTLNMGNPIPFPLVNGDTFTLVPGCTKTLAVCGSHKFNNAIHFGGMPFVPNPEIA